MGLGIASSDANRNRAAVAIGIRVTQEPSPELARSLARLDKSLSFARAAPPEVRSRFYVAADRRRKRLQRAMACEEAAGKALNQGIKEVYLDLAAQWRDLARQDQLLTVGGTKNNS